MVRRIIRKILLLVNIYDIELYDASSCKRTGSNENALKLVKISENGFFFLKELETEIGLKKLQLLKKRMLEKERDIYAICNSESKCLGYCCCATKDTWESGLRKDIKVPEGYVYFFDDFVSCQNRGKGVHRFSIQTRLKLSKEAGFTYAQVAIYHWNIKSIKNYERCGFQKKSCLLAIRPLGKVIKLWERK